MDHGRHANHVRGRHTHTHTHMSLCVWSVCVVTMKNVFCRPVMMKDPSHSPSSLGLVCGISIDLLLALSHIFIILSAALSCYSCQPFVYM